jgi:hypothetical protein
MAGKGVQRKKHVLVDCNLQSLPSQPEPTEVTPPGETAAGPVPVRFERFCRFALKQGRTRSQKYEMQLEFFVKRAYHRVRVGGKGNGMGGKQRTYRMTEIERRWSSRS